MNPDKQHLLDDLLAGQAQARREATLLAGAHRLRRRRQWRAAQRVFPVALVLLAAGLWLKTAPPPRPAPPAPVPANVAAAPAPAEPPFLTDEQLLALFPNTPVALATLPNGRKKLIFPHPGDEQKYVTHL